MPQYVKDLFLHVASTLAENSAMDREWGQVIILPIFGIQEKMVKNGSEEAAELCANYNYSVSKSQIFRYF